MADGEPSQHHTDADLAALARLAAHDPHVDDFPHANKAAVLVPLVHCRTRGLCVVLTLRAAHLRSHAGEVAFPGGKWDQTDASILATALREAHEEIGLPSSRTTYLTTLHPHISRINSLVYPGHDLVGSLTVNDEEVAAVFCVPIRTFLEENESVHASFELRWLGVQCRFHEFRTPWRWEEFRVWGLTAAVCIELARIAYARDPEYAWTNPGQPTMVELVKRWRAVGHVSKM
ncbi:hypothetical protein AMAG_15263 [Allomyces macrogynus ATCC 38327]|uniref:Nudix hydrolase domain-containing protein n=1 Tax=Allomyces macrogynus (strain ATCC 38327) TaxID=578462 RepID=A0A0L0T886_ALLM3|nr:hypothetical protein AMAG_15263 [Allomyces macrogynus ATCC 38327]|eukprot:KNE71003.1 hypothetical protein AMAG_15263 [Allomyces macrogynus ATCC 38327]